MKKRNAALAVGLALTMGLGAISLVACEEPTPATPSPFEDDTKFEEVVAPATTHFLAGQLDFYGGSVWGTVDNMPDDPGLRFKKHKEEPNLFKITVNLIENDGFKIRYEGQPWGDGASHDNIPANYLVPEQKNNANGDIVGVDDMGGQQFKVKRSGKYELWLTLNKTNNEPQSVKYVRKGDADEPEIEASTNDLRIKGGWDWNTSVLLASGLNETDGLTKTFKIKYTGTQQPFGIYSTLTGADSQKHWARNEVGENVTFVTGVEDGDENWMISEGVYEVTVTVRKDGKPLTVTFAAAADETGAIAVPAAATEA